MKIKKLEKGNATRTLLHTDVGNELIDAINALLNLKFVPADAATLQVAEGGATLTLKFPNTPDIRLVAIKQDLITGALSQILVDIAGEEVIPA